MHRPISFENLKHCQSGYVKSASPLSSEEKPRVRQLELDPPSRRVSSGNTSVQLTPNEFILLFRLIESRGEAVPRDDLARLIGAGASNKTEVYISNIRRKLEAAFGDRLIHTVRGGGYMIK